MKLLGYSHCIETQEADDWNDFLVFITAQLDYRHFIWRGQRDSSWLLEPTLDRAMRETNNIGNKTIITTHLNRFKYASRGRRGLTPPDYL